MNRCDTGASRPSRRARLALGALSTVAALLGLTAGGPTALAAETGPADAEDAYQKLNDALQIAQEKTDATAPALPRPETLEFATPENSAPPAPAADTMPPMPYCHRGHNGIRPDPVASGSCSLDVRFPTALGAPQGTILLIAAGGWRSGSYYPTMPQVQRMGRVFRDAGYLTVAVEHTSAVVDKSSGLGPAGYRDVVEWYDLIRFLTGVYFGSHHPLCVLGGSSAGHFALMLAATRAPDCLISEGAPTALRHLATSGRGRSAPNADFILDLEPQPAYDYALSAFGQAGLDVWSPARYAGAWFGMPVLMGHLPDDQLVPVSQMETFASKRAGVAGLALTTTGTPGSKTTVRECRDPALYLERTFTHLCLGGQQGVTAASLAEWRHREVALISGLSE